MKVMCTQNLLAAAPIGTSALTTTHAQTVPETKITTRSEIGFQIYDYN